MKTEPSKAAAHQHVQFATLPDGLSRARLGICAMKTTTQKAMTIAKRAVFALSHIQQAAHDAPRSAIRGHDIRRDRHQRRRASQPSRRDHDFLAQCFVSISSTASATKASVSISVACGSEPRASADKTTPSRRSHPKSSHANRPHHRRRFPAQAWPRNWLSSSSKSDWLI